MGIKHIVAALLPMSLKNSIKEKVDPKTHTAHRAYVLATGGRKPLTGRVAVVTGGSGELGRAICLRLAGEGALVYVGSRNEKRAMSVVEEVRGLDLEAEPFVTDVSDASSVEAAFAALAGAGRMPDVLVNCAGGSARGSSAPIAEQCPEVYERVIAENLLGTIHCIRFGTEGMIARGWGRVINIGSVIGERGKGGFSEYAAAKAGVHGLTRSLALELGQDGVTVNCVSPGSVPRGDYGEAMAAYARGTNCLHKLGTPEDVAGAVAYFASPETGYVTGQVLFVDGGRTLGLYGDGA